MQQPDIVIHQVARRPNTIVGTSLRRSTDHHGDDEPFSGKASGERGCRNVISIRLRYRHGNKMLTLREDERDATARDHHQSSRNVFTKICMSPWRSVFVVRNEGIYRTVLVKRDVVSIRPCNNHAIDMEMTCLPFVPFGG